MSNNSDSVSAQKPRASLSIHKVSPRVWAGSAAWSPVPLPACGPDGKEISFHFRRSSSVFPLEKSKKPNAQRPYKLCLLPYSGNYLGRAFDNG